MRLNCRDLRHRFTSLLAVWMMVVGCGVSLCHAHEAGSKPHHHGVGWNSSPDDLPPCPLGHSDAPFEFHRHLILFGFELSGELISDGVPLTGSAIDVESLLGSDCNQPQINIPALSVDSVPVGLVFDLLEPIQSHFAAQGSAAGRSVSALRAVTCVLRI